MYPEYKEPLSQKTRVAASGSEDTNLLILTNKKCEEYSYPSKLCDAVQSQNP